MTQRNLVMTGASLVSMNLWFVKKKGVCTYTEPAQSNPPLQIFLISILLLFFHLSLNLSSSPFPSHFPIIILHEHAHAHYMVSWSRLCSQVPKIFYSYFFFIFFYFGPKYNYSLSKHIFHSFSQKQIITHT
jgi:hypothetical protein